MHTHIFMPIVEASLNVYIRKHVINSNLLIMYTAIWASRQFG